MIAPRQIVPVLLLGLTLATQANAKDTGYVFVSNESSNNITVIDPAQDYRVVKRIETSHRPRDMKFRDGGRQLMVICGEDNVIDVIDLASLSVTDHIPTAADAETFELSQDEATLYIPHKAAASVHQVSVADRIIEHEIPTGAEPEGIALSSDGETLYVTSGIDDWVHVIDLGAGAVTSNISVGTRPRHLLVLPDRNELWVATALSGQVAIIDLATSHISATIDFHPPGIRQTAITPGSMTMTRDGRTVFVTLGQGDHVALVDASTRKILDYVHVTGNPRGAAISPDQEILYIANNSSNDLSVIRVASRTIIRTIQVGTSPHTVRIDGSRNEQSSLAVLAPN